MQKEVKAYFQVFILIFSIFAISNLNTENVFAQSNVCCEKTTSNEYCQFTNANNCNPNFNAASISCEQTSYCAIGTCVIENRCVDSSTRASCIQQGGNFFSGQTSNNIPECQRGCCLTGNQCSYETELGCRERTSTLTGIEFDFRDVGSEQECIALCQEEPKGCCVNANTCTLTSQSECNIAINPFTGDGFYANTICSSLSQCEFCKLRNNKGCSEDDVYWFDSCGNREEKVEDCDFSLGTICSSKTLQCESLDCEDTKDFPNNVHDPSMGGLRKNGESWCVYESGTGDYLDRPGSRHYRHICVNNEEITEPCRDFREEICVQAENREGLTESSCIENNFDTSELIEEIDSSRTTVPPGNEFWRSGGIGSSFIANVMGQAGQGCSVANRECPVVYVKECRFCDWECKENCECKEQIHVDQMAQFCKAMGDCGADFNVLDRFTSNGFRVEGDNPFREPSADQKSKWQRKGVFGGVRLLADSLRRELEKPKLSELPEQLGLAGQIGGVALAIAKYAGAFQGVGFFAEATTLQLSRVVIIKGGEVVAAEIVPTAEIGQATTQLSAEFAGDTVIVQNIGTVTTQPGFLGISMLGWIIIALVVIVVVSYLLQQDVKIEYVKTTCNPWQAPRGGVDCERCDEFESCTEYKCRSLGQLCRFIPENAGTGRISCINQNPNDVNSPIITPWHENITQGFSLNSLFYGFELIPAADPYERITIGIKTDEPSQCRLADKASVDFDSMINFFGDPFFDIQHSITLTAFPGELQEFFVRCEDVAGNRNNRDFLIRFATKPGPDLTPVRFESSRPENFATIPFFIEQLPFTLFINEPADCKYSLTDSEFDFMRNNFQCASEPSLTNNNLFSCTALLNLTLGNNEFFIRCKDSSNNVNAESYLLSLRRSSTLNITSTEPSGEVFFNDVTLRLVTEGGAENGEAVCSFGQENASILFLNTNANLHTQPLTLDFGDYNYNVFCSDIAGNLAFDSIKFSVTKDINAPALVNIFKEGSDLVLVLNEISTCEYGFTSFNFGTGQLINENSQTQRFTFEENKLYYINCQDQFGNAMRELRVIP